MANITRKDSKRVKSIVNETYGVYFGIIINKVCGVNMLLIQTRFWAGNVNLINLATNNRVINLILAIMSSQHPYNPGLHLTTAKYNVQTAMYIPISHKLNYLGSSAVPQFKLFGVFKNYVYDLYNCVCLNINYLFVECLNLCFIGYYVTHNMIKSINYCPFYIIKSTTNAYTTWQKCAVLQFRRLGNVANIVCFII